MSFRSECWARTGNPRRPTTKLCPEQDAFRIFEGTTQIQQIVIARDLLGK